MAARLGIVQFPDEILNKVFSQLNMEDLARATMVCKAWQQVASSEALWESICRRRWRLWTTPGADTFGPRLHWRKMCQQRVKLDRNARKLVEEMAWPLRRYSCLRELVWLGDIVAEELESLASLKGHQDEGTRYYSCVSLERINQRNCITAMEALLETPIPQEVSLARGALFIAKLRYQDLDVDAIESTLNDWMEVLLHRLRKDLEFARQGGLETPAGIFAALRQLNTLLFGKSGEDADQDDPGAESSDRNNMNLRANREDYYNPSNLYLNDVLDSRKGGEISLAIIHSTIGRRCAIPVQMVTIPMYFITKVGEDGDPDERFVNMSDSGRVLLRSECIDLIQTMGLDVQPTMLASASPSNIYVSICENLIAIYSQDGEQDGRRLLKERQKMLLPLLDLLLAIRPEDCSNRFTRVKVLLENSDFEAALDDIEVLLQLMDKGRSNVQDGISRALLQQYLQNAREKRERHAAWCSERRSPRPRGVRFGVGDIVKHARLDYPGVIFGWDEDFSLDEDYIPLMKIDQLQHGRAQPFYRVLVDQNFRSTSTTYVAQENIELAPDSGPILHEDLGMHFMGFRDGKYIPNAYLSYLYPDDLLDRRGEAQEVMRPESQSRTAKAAAADDSPSGTDTPRATSSRVDTTSDSSSVSDLRSQESDQDTHRKTE